MERAEALDDSRLKSRFLSYRLNLPSQDEATRCSPRCRRLPAHVPIARRTLSRTARLSLALTWATLGLSARRRLYGLLGA